MKINKYDPRAFLKNLSLVVLGTLILSFGTAIFLLPFNLVTGGVSGIALVISNLVSIKWLSIDLTVTILTWILFLLGLAVLGKNFALKTLVSTIVYPLGVSLFLRFIKISVATSAKTESTSQITKITVYALYCS